MTEEENDRAKRHRRDEALRERSPYYWLEQIELLGLEKIRLERLYNQYDVVLAIDAAIEIAEKNQRDVNARESAIREKAALDAANEANAIAKQSNQVSERANFYSVIALITSIFAALVSVLIALSSSD